MSVREHAHHHRPDLPPSADEGPERVKLLQRVTYVAREVFPCRVAVLAIPDDIHGLHRPVCTMEPQGATSEVCSWLEHGGLEGILPHQRLPLVLSDGRPPHLADALPLVESLIVVPLRDNDNDSVVGVLCLVDRVSSSRPLEVDRALSHRLSDLFAQTLLSSTSTPHVA